MSPLWPDFAIARAAWDDAADRGLVNRGETPASAPADGPKVWADRFRGKPARHPIRRRVTSYAL